MQKEEIIGIIGAGHLGLALNAGLTRVGYQTMINNGEKIRTIKKLQTAELSTRKAATLQEIAENCGEIFLCFKHAQLAEVGAELNMLLHEHQIVLSCLAQATLAEVESVLKYADPIVAKVMTTLGVTHNQGVTAYQLTEIGGAVEDLQIKNLLEVLSAKNCLFEFDSEEQMQLFTVAVGCFPGVMAHFLDQLNWAVMEQKQDGFESYAKTFSALLRSTATLLEEHGSPKQLRNSVATTGGVTQAMVQAFGSSGLSRALEQSVTTGMARMNGNVKAKKV